MLILCLMLFVCVLGKPDWCSLFMINPLHKENNVFFFYVFVYLFIANITFITYNFLNN